MFPDNPEMIEKVEAMFRKVRQERAVVLRSRIRTVGE
jgi:hypothetical protein